MMRVCTSDRARRMPLADQNKKKRLLREPHNYNAHVLELSYKSLDAISWSRVLFCKVEMMPLFSAFSKMSAIIEAA